jgi:ATP adenylyltransferase/5',5'''-P-1,P-4-tetraphosphate phosphorylase II
MEVFPLDQGRQSTGQLVFQSAIGRQKPHTLREHQSNTSCPFCDHSQLPPVIKKDGDILLVPNKYPILRDSQPFVLIETADCESELSLYPEERLLKVMRMGYDAWLEMSEDKQFRSVMFLKNHGPFSGGSLRHPHMQIIGLYNIDYSDNIRLANFYGPVVHRIPGAELNISDQPRVGFAEFNVVLTDEQAFPAFCNLVQKAVQFTLWHHHGGRIDSYNLFFYRLEGVTCCKVMPRYATTPVFMGYSIPQVVDNLDEIAEDFRRACFP